MLNDLVAEYDAMYKENPVRWDIVSIDQTRFEILQSYGAPGDKLLDVGCGSGHTLEYFAERWADTKFYGIDLSPIAVRYAKTRNPQADIRCETLAECRLKNMDIIVLGGVLEHFEDLPAAFADVHRILADDGLVYMEVPNCISYPGAHGEGFYKLRAGAQTEWHKTRPRWEEVIIDNGFKILKSIKGPKIHNEFIWLLTK